MPMSNVAYTAMIAEMDRMLADCDAKLRRLEEATAEPYEEPESLQWDMIMHRPADADIPAEQRSFYPY